MKPLLAPPMSRDQFLVRLHELIQPEVYLETGTVAGGTLVQAERAGMAIAVSIGIDLMPMNRRDNQRPYAQTVDQYFGCESCERHMIDFGLIGSRLFDDALRDLIYMERSCGQNSVIVVPYVLPTNQDMAWRVRPPGEWAGDVFKLPDILGEYRPDLTLRLVDVEPYGALLISGLDSRNVILDKAYDKIFKTWAPRHYVPDAILVRADVLTPAEALAQIAEELKRR